METTIRSADAGGTTAAGQGQGPRGPLFVHLKVHSAYSLLEGALQISSLAKLAGVLRMPAVGLTDTNNMFGVLEFSDKLAAAGIQPIAGCALQTDFGDGHGSGPSRALCGLVRPTPAPDPPALLRSCAATRPATPTS